MSGSCGLTLELPENSVDGAGAAATAHGDVELVGVVLVGHCEGGGLVVSGGSDGGVRFLDRMGPSRAEAARTEQQSKIAGTGPMDDRIQRIKRLGKPESEWESRSHPSSFGDGEVLIMEQRSESFHKLGRPGVLRSAAIAPFTPKPDINPATAHPQRTRSRGHSGGTVRSTEY